MFFTANSFLMYCRKVCWTNLFLSGETLEEEASLFLISRRANSETCRGWDWGGWYVLKLFSSFDIIIKYSGHPHMWLVYIFVIVLISINQSRTKSYTLQLHYNAVLYNAVAPKYFSSIMCENVSRRSRYYTMQTVKSILTVYFLA